MHRPAQARSSGFFLVAAAAMLLLTLLTQASWAAAPRGLAKGLVTPLEAGLTRLGNGAGAALGVLGDIATLRAENSRLGADNARLRAQVAALQAAGAENAQLRRDLGFVQASGHRALAAGVVARGPDAFASSLRIDRGEAESVRAGMVVVTGAGLVGRVVETGPHWAGVQTLADPASRVNAFTSKSALEGTVSGGAALTMLVLGKPDVVARPGEWVLTSGVGGRYPRGLVVGQLTRFQRDDAATTEHAQLAWVNDLGSLSTVLVITDFRAP